MEDNSKNLIFAKQHAVSNHTQNFYQLSKAEAKNYKRADDPGVSGYNFKKDQHSVAMQTLASTNAQSSDMKDALDKALDAHKLNVD